MYTCQKQLLKEIRKLPQKKGLEVKIITIQPNPALSKEILGFLEKIDEAHKKAKNSKLKFDYYTEPSYNSLLPRVIESPAKSIKYHT